MNMQAKLKRLDQMCRDIERMEQCMSSLLKLAHLGRDIEPDVGISIVPKVECLLRQVTPLKDEILRARQEAINASPKDDDMPELRQ